MPGVGWVGPQERGQSPAQSLTDCCSGRCVAIVPRGSGRNAEAKLSWEVCTKAVPPERTAEPSTSLHKASAIGTFPCLLPSPPASLPLSPPNLNQVLSLFCWCVLHCVLQKFHRDLPPSVVYAFGPSLALASVPGPTLIAQRGKAAQVQWGNNITDKHHFLPVDLTLGCPDTPNNAVPIGEHARAHLSAYC